MRAVPGHVVRLICLLWVPWAAAAPLHHDLDVVLHPDSHSIEIQDTITLPDDTTTSITFALHPALVPELSGTGATMSGLPAGPGGRVPALNISAAGPDIIPKRYRVELAAGSTGFTLRYKGRIRHALQQQGEEYARSFQQTRGIISPQGVFLAGASFWYPHLDTGLVTFDIDVRLPAGWKSMSQGERLSPAATDTAADEQWRCNSPQEEIYLIAGPYTEYDRTEGNVQAMVLLRRPDPALAQKYLDTTHRYIELYDALIGPYPFRKFAMVENFWETGYGMPSFTLLGSRVIRFPFILHSSYPHEILHNWWGNSVYVDYRSGNWAEGLTSYLADHLIKEQRGHGVDYRRNVLQKYTDYVSRQEDFPLTAFRSRHSARTEAVGYGKTLMLFHMLRRQLGDDVFIQGLRSFYEQYLFRVADFAALQQIFADIARQPLDEFFQQWVERTGAPRLRVSRASAKKHGEGYRLSADIEQIQSAAPYILRVPIAIHLAGMNKVYQTDIRATRRSTTLELDLPARPLQLDVDPEFDIFRRLHRSEIPPAISQAMGAERVLVVLPTQAATDTQRAYRTLAESWRKEKPAQVDVKFDNELERLPDDRAVWLFGWRNRFRPQMDTALAAYDFEDTGNGVRIEQTPVTPATHSLVVLGRHPREPDQALGWLAAASAAAVPGLGRKLPHYGRYSYLAFTGTAPDNVLKGQWPVVDSPLSVTVAQEDGVMIESGPARLAPRKALVAADERFSATRMQNDVAFLAARDLAGRGAGTAELERAAAYIATQFREAGLQPGGDDGSWFQLWQERVEPLDRTVRLKNVIGILPGSDPGMSGQSLVIGAHYDHLGRGEHSGRSEDRGRIHPGADDNASGLAVLMELARSLKDRPLPRTLVFIAFSGEETGRLGSRHYVRHPRFPMDRLIAMLNLDTVGRLGGKPLILFGTGTANEWAHIFRGVGYVTGVPVKTVHGDFGSSDQASFIEAGIPAVQFFGGTHADIHRPGDTPDKLDMDGLLKVAGVVYETTRYLAERPESLASTPGGNRHSATSPTPGTRQVSFGTVPDFTYQGDGVRLDDVRTDTPAARIGLRKGDIIVSVNEAPVVNLRQYSAALKRLRPGDEIRVRYRREGTENTVTTRVTGR
ncbi:MAG: M20/M25/M40 family metallo-hydrolase [Thiogranum sp.]